MRGHRLSRLPRRRRRPDGRRRPARAALPLRGAAPRRAGGDVPRPARRRDPDRQRRSRRSAPTIPSSRARGRGGPRRHPSDRPRGPGHSRRRRRAPPLRTDLHRRADDLRDRCPLPLGRAGGPPPPPQENGAHAQGRLHRRRRHRPPAPRRARTFDDVAIAGVADPDEARAARRGGAHRRPAFRGARRHAGRARPRRRSGSAFRRSPTAPPSAPPSRPGCPSSSRSRSPSMPRSPARSTPRCAAPALSPPSATTGATSTPSTRRGACSATIPRTSCPATGSTRRPPPEWWRREDRSGGQIVEQATHIIDLARFLAGDVTEVYGLAARRARPDFPDVDVPTASTAALRFASGAIANLSATCLLRWSHRVGLHVFADGLALEITDHDLMVDVGQGRPVRGADGDPVWRAGPRLPRRGPRPGEPHPHPLRRGGPDPPRRPRRRAIRPHGRPRDDGGAAGRPAAPVSPRRCRGRPCSPDAERTVRSLGVERPGEPFYAEYREGPARAGGGSPRPALHRPLRRHRAHLPQGHQSLSARPLGRRRAASSCPASPRPRYPVPFMGYMEVGEVVDSRAPRTLRPAPSSPAPSATRPVTPPTRPTRSVVPLPADLDPMLGVFVAQMGPICANGILHADAEALGRRDAPPRRRHRRSPGRRLGRRHRRPSHRAVRPSRRGRGARRRALRLAPRRRRTPRLRGPSRGRRLAPRPSAAGAAPEGRGADMVFQTRARSDSLHRALKALRPQGTVIDLAFYQGGLDATRLGEAFHHNGLVDALRPDRPGAPRLRRASGTAAASPPRPWRCSAPRATRSAAT